MSEAGPAAFAVPLAHLAKRGMRTEGQRKSIARLLGMRHEELADLFASTVQVDWAWPVFNDDIIALQLIDRAPCLTWSRQHAHAGGEWDAIALRDSRVPYLHSWGSCATMGGGAAVYASPTTQAHIRCDENGQPIIGVRIIRNGQLRYQHREWRDLERYVRLRRQVLMQR